MSGLRIGALAGAVFGLALATSAQAQFGPPPPLADGEGKEAVEAACTSCHTTRNIVASSGYTREDWDDLSATMIDLSADPETEAQVLDYLAEHYPPNDDRADRKSVV